MGMSDADYDVIECNNLISLSCYIACERLLELHFDVFAKIEVENEEETVIICGKRKWEGHVMYA